MKKLAFALAASAALISPAAAQPSIGTQVYWNASRQDVAVNVGTSATTGATITLTPQNGQYVYLSSVHITNCQGTTFVVAAVTSVTTTNLGGAAWTIGGGSAAGLCGNPDIVDNFGNAPLKAAAPGAVTLVLPSFGTAQIIRVSAYWYSAP